MLLTISYSESTLPDYLSRTVESNYSTIILKFLNILFIYFIATIHIETKLIYIWKKPSNQCELTFNSHILIRLIQIIKRLVISQLA